MNITSAHIPEEVKKEPHSYSYIASRYSWETEYSIKIFKGLLFKGCVHIQNKAVLDELGVRGERED